MPCKNGLIREIENLVKGEMSGLPPSHNFSHVDRVRRLALKLGKELNADLEVLELASLLHDIGLKEELLGEGDHAVISARIARELLAGKIDGNKLEKILDAIENHRYSSGRRPKYLEGLILQDADRLDALGAVGIARVFASAKANTREFYNPEDPFWETDRKLDDKEFALDHFYTKLLKLEETMNTEPGRKEAKRRTKFMIDFLDELKREVRGWNSSE